METSCDAVQLEGDQILADGNLHFAVFAQHTLKLRDGFGRDDEIALVAVRKLQIAVKKRQTAAIGRHERQLVFFERKKNSVEHITGLIHRDGVRCPAQAIFELGLPDRVSLGILEGREGGELLFREAENLEKARAAAQRGDVLRVGFEGDLGGGKFAHDGGKTAGRQRGRAGFLDLGDNLAANGDFQIRRGETQAGLGCFQAGRWSGRAASSVC